MKRFIAAGVVGVAILAARNVQAEGPAQPPSMHQYFVTITHSEQEHEAAVSQAKAQDAVLFARMEWGCRVADHIGWVVVRASSEGAALARLPAALRAGASAELVAPGFTAEHFREIRHQLNQANALQMTEG
jgi:2-methylisocitrate lyase-like PEP mutase family enzyme